MLAADQFIINPSGRVQDAARAHAAGDEIRTVIAGYHWFTDWGRDTMISLEGLTLTTGRHAEAGWILRTFAHYIRDGLIPNMFPEGENKGLYHTADATLWFFHALARYLEYTEIATRCATFCPSCSTSSTTISVERASALASIRRTACCARAPKDINSPGWMRKSTIGWSRRAAAKPSKSTRFGITPFACWKHWLREERGENAAQPLAKQAQRVRESFNRRFWYAEGGYLYDVVDGETGGDDIGLPSQPDSRHLACPTPFWTSSVGNPVLERGSRDDCLRRWGCARSARTIRITKPNTSATCARAMPLIIKARSGPG